MAGYRGLIPSGKKASGATGEAGLSQYEILDGYATSIFEGDPVALVSGTLVLCSEAQIPIGILRGVTYIGADGRAVRDNKHVAGTVSAGTLQWSGGQTNNILADVLPAENNTFMIDISGTALTQANIGSSFRLANAGTQIGTSGRSAATVGTNLAVTSETRLVRILRPLGIPGNGTIGGGQTDTSVEVEFVRTVGDEV